MGREFRRAKVICHFKNLLFLVLVSFYSLVAEWQEIPEMSWDGIDQLVIGDKNNIFASAYDIAERDEERAGVFKWGGLRWNGPLKFTHNWLPDKLSVSQDNVLYALKRSKIYMFDGSHWVLLHTFAEEIRDLFVIDKNDIWISKQFEPYKSHAFHWDVKNGSKREKSMLPTFLLGMMELSLEYSTAFS